MHVLYKQSSVSTELAMKIVQASIARAEESGLKVNAAVVDTGGNLMAFLRSNGAFLHSIEIAIDKAYTAAGFGFATSEWARALTSGSMLREGILHRPRLVTFGGGLPLKFNGELVGGVGVSGGSEDEDEDCAKAGLDMLTASENIEK
jgi:uncharacterized protein GlcG (DUF336 family)